MQKDNKFFDDLARVASGAAGELLEMKRELDSAVAARVESFMQKMNFATREEYETLQQMLSKIRMEQEEFKKRLETLEQQIKGLSKR